MDRAFSQKFRLMARLEKSLIIVTIINIIAQTHIMDTMNSMDKRSVTQQRTWVTASTTLGTIRATLKALGRNPPKLS
ncbi:hypothetical protein KIN20_004199 [Parelaphostrongylus tenuis]|uniref:Uncharacterized protein n=1 Tax=Parelaphostrongylus tenuis TaxID=148309 RepID=A0AAD5M1C2_PARTN|nr:hypothetical protein KIN20_004199 [Parelaphostrongylus tenuis]